MHIFDTDGPHSMVCRFASSLLLKPTERNTALALGQRGSGFVTLPLHSQHTVTPQ